jgi:hypothetical protein
MNELVPGRQLEGALKIVYSVFNSTHIQHWLMFGGLWGMIVNRGIVPDADLDFCAKYPADWRLLARLMGGRGYTVRKVLLNDANRNEALYMGFDGDEVHICVSFWYKWKEMYFWCHDQNNEVVSGEGIPANQGYFFKGCPQELIEGEERFMVVDWPGIPGETHVRVPVFAGQLLDLCYPGWMYWKQRYNVHNYQFQEDKCVSVNNPKYNKNASRVALSPYMVNVRSMNDFADEAAIRKQLDASRQRFEENLQKRFKR